MIPATITRRGTHVDHDAIRVDDVGPRIEPQETPGATASTSLRRCDWTMTKGGEAHRYICPHYGPCLKSVISLGPMLCANDKPLAELEAERHAAHSQKMQRSRANREALLTYIREHPGCHTSDMMDALGLDYGRIHTAIVSLREAGQVTSSPKRYVGDVPRYEAVSDAS